MTLVGRSLDLKAGQAVDRVGVLLGLSFPCGPELERLALQWEGGLSYRPVLKGHDCSLSGIENQCKAMIQRGDPPEKTARYCLEALAAVLDKMCGGLLQELGDLPAGCAPIPYCGSASAQNMGQLSPRRNFLPTTLRARLYYAGKRGQHYEGSSPHCFASEFFSQVPY